MRLIVHPELVPRGGDEGGEEALADQFEGSGAPARENQVPPFVPNVPLDPRRIMMRTTLRFHTGAGVPGGVEVEELFHHPRADVFHLARRGQGRD